MVDYKSGKRKRIRYSLCIRINPWVVIVLMWVGVFVLGIIGLIAYTAEMNSQPTFLDMFYKLLQLMVLESNLGDGGIPWQLEVARFGLPLLAAGTALQAMMILFNEQIRRLTSRFWRGHVVIGGLNQKSSLLVKGYLARGTRVIVIERNEAHGQIETCKRHGAVVLIGDPNDPVILNQARIDRASMLVAVSDNDQANAEIAVRANSLCLNRCLDPLCCVIHIVDPALWDLLQERQFSGQYFENIRLEMFNVYLHGAKILVDEYILHRKTRRSTFLPRHVLVIGMDKLGTNLIVETAKEWFFRRADSKARIRMTLIDRGAKEVLALLDARYPGLTSSADITALNMSVNSPEFIRGEHLVDVDGMSDIDIAVICYDDPSEALFTGLTLRRRLSKHSTQIVMRVPEESGMADLIQGRAEEDDLVSIQPFGLLERTCTPEILSRGMHETLARALHEEYLSHQEKGRVDKSDRIASRPWMDLPESVRAANRRQADRIGELVNHVGCGLNVLWDWTEPVHQFTESEVETMAEMEHERWCLEKSHQGWKYAPGSQDPTTKCHPALVPWDELPEADKEKNRTAARELPTFLARVGYKVKPLGAQDWAAD
jgi:voltage-gated potassium channel Kch